MTLRETRKLKENNHLREEDLKMQGRRIPQFLIRDSIQLRRDMECSRQEAVVGNHYIFGYVIRIKLRGIVCGIIVVVDYIFIFLMRHIQLVMLIIAFFRFMDLWRIGT